MGWRLRGKVVIACNCDYGCPCNFNARPTKGKCEGGWTWHVEDGEYDGTSLDGLTFSIFVNWPGAIHEGGGEALILVDERADDAQVEAIQTLVGGEVGGPWGVLAWTWPTVHGPTPVKYEADFAGLDTHVRAGDVLDLQVAPIRNPVSGAEARPGVVLPQGIILKQAELGTSSTFSVRDGISYDHSGQYAAIGPFDYSGPE